MRIGCGAQSVNGTDTVSVCASKMKDENWVRSAECEWH